MKMACKRKSKNLFQTALDKIIGRHTSDNVYEVTVIYKSKVEGEQVIDKHYNNEAAIDNEFVPKPPPRRRSRHSSLNSLKSVHLLSDFESDSSHNTSEDPPKPPPRRRSRPSSQNSCRSLDLHSTSQSPSRPPRKRSYSQSSNRGSTLGNYSIPPRSKTTLNRNFSKPQGHDPSLAKPPLPNIRKTSVSSIERSNTNDDEDRENGDNKPVNCYEQTEDNLQEEKERSDININTDQNDVIKPQMGSCVPDLVATVTSTSNSLIDLRWDMIKDKDSLDPKTDKKLWRTGSFSSLKSYNLSNLSTTEPIPKSSASECSSPVKETLGYAGWRSEDSQPTFLESTRPQNSKAEMEWKKLEDQKCSSISK